MESRKIARPSALAVLISITPILLSSLIFTPPLCAQTTIFSSTSVPAQPSASDSSPIEVGVKFESSVNGYIKGIRFYKGPANSGTHIGHLWTSTGRLLGTVTFTNETATGWQEADFAAPIAVTAKTMYVASYHTDTGGYGRSVNYFSKGSASNPPLLAPSASAAGGNGVYMYGADAFPNDTFSGSNYWVDVDFTQNAAPATESTIWSSSAAPSQPMAPATGPCEVGVKFESTVGGFIKGIRFYKGSANTGAHVGHLWTATGTLLGTVTFTNETAKGWQEADFSKPIPIAAKTTYVASYHTNTGGYARDRNYFSTNAVSNPPLLAPSSGTAEGNGVYVFGASSFPNQTYMATNYWVDVAFTTIKTQTQLSIGSSALPTGVVGTAYSATLSVTGGTAPYNWTLVSGQMPPGLTLNSDGTISGTPTVYGSYSFTVLVSDSGGNQKSGPASISVASPGGVTQLLSASPASLSFGNVTVGTINTLPVVVTNTGSGSVTISKAATTGAGFGVSGPTLPMALAAGQNVSFSVSFDPSAAGSVSGSASVVSSATNSPATVSLSGVGVNEHSVALSWVASTSPNITGYNVYRGTAAGGPYTKLNSSLVAGTSYADTTVQAGQTYYYVTTAVNSQGVESADSNQTHAVVPVP